MNATATKAVRAVKVMDGYYATLTGVRPGPRGKVVLPGALYARMTKGEVRRLRKALHVKGFVGHAAAERFAG